ncbi:MAG: D-aminoacylase [Chitinophagaceae bacterium]|jgi:N-acyl-D-amino-acid deacylase|nr:D-aminoacylase [Chitinophagaceae bacterium]
MKRLLLLLIPCFAFSQQAYDVIIRNGKIIDGTGNSWYYADVAVKDGKIALIQKHISASATKIIDAKGLIVAPGFIDVHGHIEGSIFERPTADNYIYDGVTTVITGNCGGSADDLQQFFFRIDSMHTSINIASLMGHNNVRRIVMGLNNRLATPEEQKQMEILIAKAMKDGAVGMSTGLIYLPGMYSNTDEVIGLAKETAKYSGVYASHIRNEENGVVDAINEAINIGRSANIPVQISHFKLSGPANWGRSSETLSLIETARKDGYDVTIDQYPYTASSTNLGVRLPDWALAGGPDSLKKRINDPVIHKQMIDEMLVQLKKYKYKNYSFAVVANHAADSTLNGKSITQINQLKGRKSKPREEAETILELMLAGGAQMVYHSMSEKDVQFFMKYPYNMVGADAGVATGKGMPHPRTYGTNARVLGRYVREQQIISLEEAVRRMTSLPAQKFQLKDRGLIKEGMAADILLFNEAEVTDKATFENPHQFSAGFKYILVNGQLVIDAGKHNGIRSGKALFGPAYSNQ